MLLVSYRQRDKGRIDHQIPERDGKLSDNARFGFRVFHKLSFLQRNALSTTHKRHRQALAMPLLQSFTYLLDCQCHSSAVILKETDEQGLFIAVYDLGKGGLPILVGILELLTCLCLDFGTHIVHLL